MATVKHPANLDLMGSSLLNVGSLSGPASLLLSGAFAYQSISSATSLSDDSNNVVLRLANSGSSAYDVALMSNPYTGRVLFVFAEGSNSKNVRLTTNKRFKDITSTSPITTDASLTVAPGKMYFLIYSGMYWFYKEL